MKYKEPLNEKAGSGASYVDVNEQAGIDGSIVPAAAIEHPMREIVGVITDAGLTPSGDDLGQLSAAIRQRVNAGPIEIPVKAGYGGGYAPDDLDAVTYAKMLLGRPMKITNVLAAVETAPAGSALIFDVLVDGTSIFTTPPQFAAGSTALTAGVLRDATREFAAGSVLDFRVTQVGGATAGAGLLVTIQGTGHVD